MLMLLLATGCDRRADDGPVDVEVIGGPATLVDASRHLPGPASRVLAGAVAQGLVSFDAAGQIEPGIAERWTVIDNGTSYIFRLRDAHWQDGRPVTAGQVVAALRHQVAQGSRNPLTPFLSAVEEIVEMTPEVIEVRLSRPRPDLLKLFAQPELAIMTVQGSGSGPYRPVTARARQGVLLRLARDVTATDDDGVKTVPSDDVRLRVDRPAIAILRFVRHQVDLVGGGTIADWPLLTAAGLAPATIRIDPAAGLFGLAIENREGFLGDAANRDALSAAMDRQALSTIAGGVPLAAQVLPESLDSAAAPAMPAWIDDPIDVRRALARSRVAAWLAARPATAAGSDAGVTLRLALPAGPGGTVLWGQLAATLLAVGITPVRVAIDAPADLRLVDAVAPYDSARWYLATACRPCGADAQARLEEARAAPSVTARAEALARADQAVAADVPFIPLLRPLRWSLVALRLNQWQGNARAWHPLNHLRDGPI
ncbi:ABC transporter substrate-binding protein [uncultured Sphingomonas sp.]|uniref:ABC transporter substrate-binding protein n=1 Tax=uncultured Sphingomonas sp. TaxID=158754 RepID=UPI0035CC7E9F